MWAESTYTAIPPNGNIRRVGPKSQTSWSNKTTSRVVFTIKEPCRNGGKVKNVFYLDVTVHSVGAEGPHSISLPLQRWAVGPHLLLSDSSKACTLFHRSLGGLPAAHTFFWVILTTPTPKWRWFHRVRCGFRVFTCSCAYVYARVRVSVYVLCSYNTFHTWIGR